MPQESNPATSQPAAPAKSSDVKSTTAANVTAAQAVARFAQAEQQAGGASPTGTEAATPPPATTPETPAAEAAPEAQSQGSETPEGESAQTDLPEASPVDESAQAPATAPTEGEEHDEAGETDVLSPESPLDPRLKEKIQKRINKERAKRGEIERQVDQLKNELAALKQAQQPAAETPAATTPTEEPIAPAPSALPVPPVPLADHNDVSKLKQLEQEAVIAVDSVQDLLDTSRGWKDYNVPNPDNPEETITISATKVGNQLYTREQLVEIRRKAISTMREVPQRIAFINAREAATQQAHQLFPFLKDKNSPEYQQAQAWRRGAPWLNNLPNADLIIGVQIEGMKAIEARKAAAAKVAEKPKPAAVMPKVKPAGDQAAVSTAGAVERTSVEAKQRQTASAEMEKMRAKGGVTGSEVAAFLARKELLNSR